MFFLVGLSLCANCFFFLCIFFSFSKRHNIFIIKFLYEDILYIHERLSVEKKEEHRKNEQKKYLYISRMSNKNQKLLHQQNTAFKLMKLYFFNNKNIKFNAIEDAVKEICYCLK